ncbi:MAG: ABC transporter permease subunit [Synergistaceae bacterium]|nr:ABC transporter permease subunit [Synergistaceae bacterium]
MHKRFYPAALMLCLMMCSVVFAGERFTSLEQLNNPNCTVGLDSGSAASLLLAKIMPEAKKAYFNDSPTAYLAVKQGKIDAYAFDRLQMENAIAEGLSGVRLLPENIGEGTKIAVGISRASKIDGLKGKINQFISEVKADGTFRDMYRRWAIGKNRTMPDIPSVTGSGLKLRVGTTGLVMPHSYYEGDKLTGLDVELAKRFAKWLGAELELRLYDYGGLVAAASTGEIDCIMANLNITAERAEKIDFSDVLYTEEVAIMVKDEAPAAKTEGYSSVLEYDGKRIGVCTGNVHAEIVKEVLPSAELSYFDGIANMVNALTSGKIDAIVLDDSIIKELERESPSLKHLDEYLQTFDNAFIFTKSTRGENLRSELNEFIRSLRSDGTLEKLNELWAGNDETVKTLPDYENYPDTNGVISIALDNETPPFAYVKNNRVIGYDVDIIVRFCKAKGYRPQISSMNFAAVIPAVQSGKCDLGIGAITITPERAESVNFSEPVYTGGAMMLVKKSTEEPGSPAKYSKISDLNGKRIGVQTGVEEWTDVIRRQLPDSKIIYYNTFADLTAALKSGKIDAFPCDSPVMDLIVAQNNYVASLGEMLEESFDVAVAFPKNAKGEKLKPQWDEFITSIKKEGKLDALVQKWTGPDDNAKTMLNYSSLPATNGKLVMATEGEYPPFNYYSGRKMIGFEVELAALFAEKYGYALEVKAMSYEGIFAAVQSGRCDFALSALSPQAEHAEMMLFSVPYYACSTRMAVLAKNLLPSPAPEKRARFTKISDLAGKRIAVLTGTTHPQIAKQYVPTGELVYFDNAPDTFTALKMSKVDAICTSIPIAKMAMAEDDSFAFFGEQLTHIECAPIFAKTETGRKLREQFSDFLKAQWDNGTIQEMDSLWFEQDESKRILKDYSQLPSPNGVLKMAAEISLPPFIYVKDNKITGYDVDTAVRFCEEYGYGLEIVPMNFSGIIPSIVSGKCDFGMGGITRTAEREESVLFSYPNARGGNAFVVKKSDIQPQTKPQKISSARFTGIQDLAGKRIGVTVGTTNAQTASKFVPDAEIVYFDSRPDALIAIKQGKIDAICMGQNTARFLLLENEDLAILGKPMVTTDTAPIFPKTEEGRKLCGQFSEFAKAQRDNGFIQELDAIWFGPDDSKRTAKDYASLPAPNGILKMATDTAAAPFAYMKDSKIVGYEVDFAVKFCETYGYGLEIVPMSFGAIIPAVMSGKCDFGACTLSITPERAESVLFSAPNGISGEVMVVRKADIESGLAPQSSARFSKINDLAGKRIGVQTGTTNDKAAAKAIPDVRIDYFESFADILVALRLGKIDAACLALNAARFALLSNEDLVVLDKPLAELDAAPIFAKTEEGRKLCDKFNDFIKAQWDNGTFQRMDTVWFGKDESKRTVKDYSNLPATNGTLKMAVDTTLAPFAYVKDNRIVGYEVEMAVKFCEENGYGLEVVPMNFGALIPAVKSGKCDFASCTIAITQERAEQVLFGSPNAKTGNVIVVRKSDTQPQQISSARFTNIDELAGKKIGVQTGTTNAQIVAKNIPTAKAEYFESLPDALIALRTGKIEAICCSIFAARYMMLENDNITYINHMLTDVELAPIFTSSDKGRKLSEEYGEFMRALWADGTVTEIDSLWLGRDEASKVTEDYTKLPAPNGTLKMAVDPSAIPFTYMKDNRITGYDIDLAVRFCKAKGYGLEIVPMAFAAIVPAVMSGKCDFSCCMIYTPERAQSVLYSPTPNAKSGNVIVVMKARPVRRGRGKHSSLADMAGRTVGIILGANHDTFASAKIPDVKIEYFQDLSTITLALQNGKIDAFANTLPTAIYMTHERKDISYIPEPLEITNTYSAFTNSERGREICAEYSEFLQSLWDNGTIEQLAEKWIYGEDESLRTLEDYSALPATNGTLKMAIDTGRMPFAYVKDNRIIGYDIELATMFCKAKGYGLEVYAMDFAGILGSIKTGKCDLTGSITRTEERAETMLFSPVPNAETPIVLIVMKEAPQAVSSIARPSSDAAETTNEPSFLDDLAASFNRTFIREERWRLFAEGIVNTMIITVLSIICGTVLGFVVYLFCRGGNPIANLITRFFVWLIQGMPMVVLLMILYYIIFGKVDISGIWVAVIAFSLTFGAGVYGMLLSGVKALDKGQTEAAYALGFSDRRTFFTVILPQAALHFMPAYKAEVVALIKATAIVGYIAVQDLTKMGDIVRSRTYEAFFPLIAVAVIYFVLAGLLNLIVNAIHNRIRPEKRTRDDILRGIDIHD